MSVLSAILKTLFVSFGIGGKLISNERELNSDAQQQPSVRIIEPVFRKVCDGLPTSEGPVFDTKGNFYAVSPGTKRTNNGSVDESQFRDEWAGKLHKINLETGEKTDMCTALVNGFGGRPAGCQSDKFDNIWIADIRLGLLKYSPGSNDCQLVSNKDDDGNLLHGCNDLVFDKNGNLWITAPGLEVAPAQGEEATAYTIIGGNLYFLEQGHSTPKAMNESFQFVNGIAIKDDLLLVAETMKRRILAFDIVSKGELANRRVWANLPEASFFSCIQ
uniref:diisopropyl-fluorophosphatase-like isoform X2 n=1 Tax=Styela clava TaxID=7725 RepID=UPI00193A218E|nr:diisopropyl-fluorophosphatase-like isoform X2 [Styela clava]